jgi:hypothetical protein
MYGDPYLIGSCSMTLLRDNSGSAGGCGTAAYWAFVITGSLVPVTGFASFPGAARTTIGRADASNKTRPVPKAELIPAAIGQVFPAADDSVLSDDVAFSEGLFTAGWLLAVLSSFILSAGKSKGTGGTSALAEAPLLPVNGFCGKTVGLSGGRTGAAGGGEGKSSHITPPVM